MPKEMLSGCKIAILTIDGFDGSRFFGSRDSLVEAGAITTVVSSSHEDLIRSWHPSNDGVHTPVDRHVGAHHPAYDALFLPGTVVDPEAVFVDPRTADFVKSFFDLGRPIASLCRDRWLFVHRNTILGGRVRREPLISSDFVSFPDAPVPNAEAGGPDEDLDEFIRNMLAFFQASITQTSRSTTPRAVPFRRGPDLDRRSRLRLRQAGDASTMEVFLERP